MQLPSWIITVLSTSKRRKRESERNRERERETTSHCYNKGTPKEKIITPSEIFIRKKNLPHLHEAKQVIYEIYNCGNQITQLISFSWNFSCRWVTSFLIFLFHFKIFFFLRSRKLKKNFFGKCLFYEELCDASISLFRSLVGICWGDAARPYM